MKGKKVLLYLIICIGLVSCSKNEQEGYGENYNRKYDSQNFSANREQTVTEDGFYTIQEEYIFFVDKKSGKAIPLCGKVNCKHNDSTCNAYFNAPLNIQAYDGKIYVVARGSKDRTESLYRISLDGSKKEELKVLYANEDNDVSCALEFMIHRGYGLNNLGAVEPAVRRKVSHSIYTCFCLGYGMRSGISCKACYRTADAARA